MATPNLGYQDKYSSTLSSGIVASDTTIPITSLPTPTEGYLVLEPDSATAFEVIYYTSKTGSAVVCPSAAAGRGLGGSTAASHNQGATVRMDTVAEFFSTLQDATALTGLHRYGTDGTWFDFVASGGVITADSAGSTLNYSITSGVVYINGRRHTFAAVNAQACGANKDRYIDLLYSTVDNVATLVNTEVSNNAASPALASNSVRLGIVVGGATSIAASTSINQGQESRVLPIASSIAYSVTDSLGNLICPRDPNRKILGYSQIVATTSTALTTTTDITGLSTTVIVPTGRKIRITTYVSRIQSSQAAGQGVHVFAREGSTSLAEAIYITPVSNYSEQLVASVIITPTAGSHTYKGSYAQDAAGTLQITFATPVPAAYLLVELV